MSRTVDTLGIVDHGIGFLARIVRAGDKYGLDNCLTHPAYGDSDTPMVEFYDTRHAHTVHGQFVSRYYVDVLLGRTKWGTATGGLLLDGGNPDRWYIGAENMAKIRAWLTELFPVNPPADPAPDMVAALAAALRAMLREHDALVMASGGTGDRWPAATAARAALARVQP